MSFKYPDYRDGADRELYEELRFKDELTEEERRFCITMYHQEEYYEGDWI